MDTYSTEMLKLSPSADICVSVPLVVLENSACSDKHASDHCFVNWTAFYVYLTCRFADAFSTVNKINVELAKKIHTTEDNVSSSWNKMSWIQRKEEAQLCAASYLCGEFVVFLEGETSCNTQDLNH